ncbi:FRG domain-containing protein [Schaalia sp. ORNL0103]|uniref:FRG domain-containing protein n=1 Tax=Schaalia sp. ORNL0103 TaxID=2789426 RepID=UPI001CA51C2B|nr:FRG domain-containing protein [Schaalia sp. ORNL0103]
MLQHHGSPTRLIDVTSDWKIALYFACESDNDVDGRIFLIKTNIFNWKLFRLFIIEGVVGV